MKTLNLVEMKQKLYIDLDKFVSDTFCKTHGLVWFGMYQDIAKEHQDMTIEDVFDKYSKLTVDDECEDEDDFLLYKAVLFDYLTDLIDDKLSNQNTNLNN